MKQRAPHCSLNKCVDRIYLLTLYQMAAIVFNSQQLVTIVFIQSAPVRNHADICCISADRYIPVYKCCCMMTSIAWYIHNHSNLGKGSNPLCAEGNIFVESIQLFFFFYLQTHCYRVWQSRVCQSAAKSGRAIVQSRVKYSNQRKFKGINHPVGTRILHLDLSCCQLVYELPLSLELSDNIPSWRALNYPLASQLLVSPTFLCQTR